MSLAAVVPAVFIAAIILRTVTCYYVRFLLRRFAWLHPTHCNTKDYLCDPEPTGLWAKAPFSWLAKLLGKTLYFGDSKLFYYHKYFIWATVILMPFHLREVIPVFLGSLSAGTTFELLDVSVEMLYVLFGVLFILSCHSIKYFFDRTAAKCGDCALAHQAYHTVEKANDWHALWLWLTIVFINVRLVLLLAHGTPLLSALVMLFVRLPEHA